MADSKITALTSLAANPADLDQLVIVDVSDTSMAASGTDKRIAASYFATRTGTETFTNKTLTSPVVTGSSNAAVMDINGSGGQALRIIGAGAVSTGIGWRSTAIGSNFTLPSDNIPQVDGTTGYIKGYAIGFASEDSSDTGLTFWSGSGIGSDMTLRASLSNAGVFNVVNSITQNGTALLLATGATTGASSQAQTFTNGIIGPSWKPASDSTTAIKIQNSGASADIVTVDTTNSRVSITGRLTVSGSTSDTVALALTPTQTSSNTSQQQLFQIQGTLQPSGATLTDAYAMINLFTLNSSSANITTARAIYGQVTLGASYSGTVTGVRTIEISNATVSGGTISTQYGLYVNHMTTGTNNYAIFTNSGLVKFGGQTQLVASTTGRASLNIASGSAPTTPVAGDVWNDGALSFYNADSTTASVVNHLRLRRNSTGTAAAGFGLGIIAELESSTTDAQSAGRLIWAWSDATHASRAATGKLTAYYTSTERPALSWTADSTGVKVGIGTESPTQELEVNGNIRISAGTSFYVGGPTDTGIDGLRLTYASSNAYLDIKTGAFICRLDTSIGGTERMRLTNAGLLGVGVAAPQGILHAHDGSGGFMFVNRSGVGGTLVTVIPDGTGDVTEKIGFIGWCTNSSPFSSDVALTTLDVSSSTTKTDGVNTLTIAVTAAGAFTLQATAGAATWKVCIWIFWR